MLLETWGSEVGGGGDCIAMALSRRSWVKLDLVDVIYALQISSFLLGKIRARAKRGQEGQLGEGYRFIYISFSMY